MVDFIQTIAQVNNNTMLVHQIPKPFRPTLVLPNGEECEYSKAMWWTDYRGREGLCRLWGGKREYFFQLESNKPHKNWEINMYSRRNISEVMRNFSECADWIEAAIRCSGCPIRVEIPTDYQVRGRDFEIYNELYFCRPTIEDIKEDICLLCGLVSMETQHLYHRLALKDENGDKELSVEVECLKGLSGRNSIDIQNFQEWLARECDNNKETLFNQL